MIENKLNNYARQKKSKALINTDEVGLLGYKQTRSNFKKIEELKTEINGIKSDVGDIKEMLKLILNGSKNG